MKLIRIGDDKHVLTIGTSRILFSHNTPVAAYLADSPALVTGYVRTEAKGSMTAEQHINEWFQHAEDNPEYDLVPQEVLDGLVQIPEGMAQ